MRAQSRRALAAIQRGGRHLALETASVARYSCTAPRWNMRDVHRGISMYASFRLLASIRNVRLLYELVQPPLGITACRSCADLEMEAAPICSLASQDDGALRAPPADTTLAASLANSSNCPVALGAGGRGVIVRQSLEKRVEAVGDRIRGVGSPFQLGLTSGLL